jgi:hypothetical protein
MDFYEWSFNELSWMKQNITKLIETNKVLSTLAMCENWAILLFYACPQKTKTFQAILGNL